MVNALKSETVHQVGTQKIWDLGIRSVLSLYFSKSGSCSKYLIFVIFPYTAKLFYPHVDFCGISSMRSNLKLFWKEIII